MVLLVLDVQASVCSATVSPKLLPKDLLSESDPLILPKSVCTVSPLIQTLDKNAPHKMHCNKSTQLSSL